MKKTSFKLSHIVGFVISTNLLLASNTSIASSAWKLEKDDSDIQVFLRNTPASSIKSFKGTVNIKSSLATLVKTISDPSNYHRWLHNSRNGKNLKQIKQFHAINYVVTDMPWPVVDRDLIFQSILKQNPSTKQVSITLEAKPKFAKNKPGKVRIEKMKGSWMLTPSSNGWVKVNYEMAIDPGGNIPKWLVNTMSVDVPFYTLKNLRTLSKEPRNTNAKVEGISELK